MVKDFIKKLMWITPAKVDLPDCYSIEQTPSGVAENGCNDCSHREGCVAKMKMMKWENIRPYSIIEVSVHDLHQRMVEEDRRLMHLTQERLILESNVKKIRHKILIHRKRERKLPE